MGLEPQSGSSGISKIQVSRLCGEIDDRVQTFLTRPLEGDWPCVWLDATYAKVREAGRIVAKASPSRWASTAPSGLSQTTVCATRQTERQIHGFFSKPSFRTDFKDKQHLKPLTERG